jgi:ATP-dependent Clp protease ATP-binding subunit ClpB
MTRIDLSEYQESHAVARLIGAPPGYVGYEEGGQLTEAVRRRPYSVILLDEIEKAHPQIFNLFLQVFDEGRLTDSKGISVDFRNTIIIMTSNLGSDVIIENHKNVGIAKEKVWDILHRHFRPEFLNRLDSVVLFNTLSAKVVMQVAKLQLEEVKTRLQENNIDLIINDELVSYIAEEGYDPAFGARPLKRVIEEKIVDSLALRIIEGSVKPGDTITPLVKDGEIVIE